MQRRKRSRTSPCATPPPPPERGIPVHARGEKHGNGIVGMARLATSPRVAIANTQHAKKDREKGYKFEQLEARGTCVYTYREHEETQRLGPEGREKQKPNVVQR